jgi:AcrR family transcriptional regulator
MFDEDRALEIAMRVFWHKGYVGTSLSDLTAAIGINKPSLYAAFGNKEQLFASALARYGNRYGLPHAKRLLEPADAPLRDRLRNYLSSIARMLTDPSLPGGCLIAQSSYEAGGGNLPEEATRTLTGLRQETRRLLGEVLKQEQAAENMRSETDPDRMASYVMTLMMGMAAMARGGADLAELEGVISLATDSIHCQDLFS